MNFDFITRWYSTKKAAAIFRALTCAFAASFLSNLNATEISFCFTNSYGQPDTNVFKIIPVSGPTANADGSFITRGLPIRVTPALDGCSTNFLMPGNYLATNSFLGCGLYFGNFPDDPDTNTIYNCSDYIISGANIFVTRIITNSASVSQITNSLGYQPISFADLISNSFLTNNQDSVTFGNVTTTEIDPGSTNDFGNDLFISGGSSIHGTAGNLTISGGSSQTGTQGTLILGQHVNSPISVVGAMTAGNAANQFDGSFSGSGSGLTGLTNIPETGVSNLVQDLASVPIVANDEFFDFNSPIINTPYYKLNSFQGTAFSTGEFYAAGTTELYKYSLTGTLLKDNANPFASLPGGIDHLGGMDFYSNAVYSAACYFGTAGLPYVSSNGVIAIYLTNDLSLQSYFYVTNWMPDISGLAIDPTSNIIYASSFIDTTNLFEFSLTNHAFLGTLTLGTAINGIQGLTVMGNMLVVSGHIQQNVPEVWFFDKTTGAEISPPKYLPQIGEIEDLSIYQSNLVATVGVNNYTFVPMLTTNLTARVGASGFKGKNLLLNSVSSVSSVLSRDPMDDGLVLCYHFDETSGQLVHDSSPSGNEGWATTNNILGNAGLVGYGAFFSTNAVYANNNAMVANPDHLTGLTNITINLWANSPTNFSSTRAFINKHVANNVGEWFLNANSSTSLQFSLINAAQSRVDLSCNFPAGVAFTNNVWHMVTATYDGSKMNLYLDGNLLGSASQTGVIQAIPGLQIGIGNFYQTEIWNGGIDELKIWNRALATNEISLLYNQVSNNKNFSSVTGTFSGNGGGLTNLSLPILDSNTNGIKSQGSSDVTIMSGGIPVAGGTNSTFWTTNLTVNGTATIGGLSVNNAGVINSIAGATFHGLALVGQGNLNFLGTAYGNGGGLTNLSLPILDSNTNGIKSQGSSDVTIMSGGIPVAGGTNSTFWTTNLTVNGTATIGGLSVNSAGLINSLTGATFHGLTLLGSGNLNFSGTAYGNGGGLTNIFHLTTSSATSGTVSAATSYQSETTYLSSGSTIASITIALPTTTIPGQRFVIHTKSAITALTVTGGSFIDSAISTEAAGGTVIYQAVDAVGTYIKLD